MLIAYFDHKDPAVKAEIRAGHRQRGAPLAGSGLGGNPLQPLLFGVIGLGHRRVELVAARGVVAFEFVVDMRRSAQLLLKAISPDERRGTVHFVEVMNFVWDFNKPVVVVKLLSNQFFAEYGRELFGGHRLKCPGIEQRRRLYLHIGADIVPVLRKLVF